MIALALAGCALALDTPVYFSPDPGVAKCKIRRDGFVLRNATVSLDASISGGQVDTLAFNNLIPNETTPQ